MNNKQTLQSIWSITDKPLINIMTKENQRATAAHVKYNYSDNSSDSDSDGNNKKCFVPEKYLTSKMTKCQSHVAPINYNYSINRNNSDSDDSSKGSFIAVPDEFRPCLPPSLKKKTEEISDDSHNRDRPCIQNLNLDASEPPQNKLSYLYPENLHSTCKSYKQLIFPNSSEIERSETCSQITKAKYVQDSQKAKTDFEVIKDNTTSKQIHKKIDSNSLSFQKQCSATNSKAPKNKHQRKKLQYAQINKQSGTVQFKFEMPLAKEKISVTKEGLKYEAKFSENIKQQKGIIFKKDNFRSRSRIRQHKTAQQDEHSIPFQENVVKWDSTLSLNEQEDCANHNKIEWTVIHEKKPFSPKRKTKCQNTQQNNKSKSTNLNQTDKLLREKSSPKQINYLMKDKISYNQYNLEKSESNNAEIIQLKHNLRENEYNSENKMHKKNLQLNDNLNCIRNEEINYATKPIRMNEEEFMQQCSFSEQNIKHDQNIRMNEEEFMQQCSINEQNVKHDQNIHFSSLCMSNLKQALDNNYEPNNSSYTKVKDSENLNSVLHYGKDITDLIIGSHTALSVFISFYNEWKFSRQVLIKHFEQLEKNLKDSSKKFTKYRDIVNIASTGATFATAIPNPHISMAAKIVSVLSNLFATFLNNTKRNTINDSNDITACLFKDAHTSNELYMYGLQCNQQFEETTKLIEEFHSRAEKQELFKTENQEINKFIQGILEYRPTHRIFYKKMYKCFQELLQNSLSPITKKFCEPFLLYSTTAVDVIGFLDWRFRYENFNSESVRYELEQLHRLIQESNTTSLKDLVKRIQTCIRILTDEFIFVEQCLKDVSPFDTLADKPVTKENLKF